MRLVRRPQASLGEVAVQTVTVRAYGSPTCRVTQLLTTSVLVAGLARIGQPRLLEQE